VVVAFCETCLPAGRHTAGTAVLRHFRDSAVVVAFCETCLPAGRLDIRLRAWPVRPAAQRLEGAPTMPRTGHKRKAYDDRALALALARPTKPTSQIAGEFGLNEEYVREIRRGEKRPELQRLMRAIRQEADDELEARTCQEVWALLAAQIRTALTGSRGLARRCREYLLDRFLPPEEDAPGWIEPGSPAAKGASGAARRGVSRRRTRGTNRKKFYDEESRVHDLAEGRLSLRQIARNHGLTPQFVCRVRQGRTRPDLMARLDPLRQLLQIVSRLQVRPWLKALAAKEAHVGITGDGDTARVCREYLLDRFLPHDGSNSPWQRKRSRTRRN